MMNRIMSLHQALLSMYLLFIAVVTFRSRGLFGKKSALDA